VSTTSRGNQAQDDAKAALEREGWLVTMAKPSVRVRWNRARNDYEREVSHDYFGLVDLIAVKPDRVRFVQVTHASGRDERVAKIRAGVATALLSSLFLSWEVWVRQNGGFQIVLVLPLEVKA